LGKHRNGNDGIIDCQRRASDYQVLQIDVLNSTMLTRRREDTLSIYLNSLGKYENIDRGSLDVVKAKVKAEPAE
jgi:hypothetical protein